MLGCLSLLNSYKDDRTLLEYDLFKFWIDSQLYILSRIQRTRRTSPTSATSAATSAARSFRRDVKTSTTNVGVTTKLKSAVPTAARWSRTCGSTTGLTILRIVALLILMSERCSSCGTVVIHMCHYPEVMSSNPAVLSFFPSFFFSFISA